MEDTVIEVKASVILDMRAAEVRKVAGDKQATEAVADRISAIAKSIRDAEPLGQDPPSATAN